MIEASLLLDGASSLVLALGRRSRWLDRARAWRMAVGVESALASGPRRLLRSSSLLPCHCPAAGATRRQARRPSGARPAPAPGRSSTRGRSPTPRSDDTFFVVDRLARVQHLDRDGQVPRRLAMPEWQNGKPVGVSVGPDGNVYVPDTHYQRVMVYTPDGRAPAQWGRRARGPGQFIYPTDVAFDDKGHVFVSEYGDNDRIQVFDRDGKFLYAFGTLRQRRRASSSGRSRW